MGMSLLISGGDRSLLANLCGIPDLSHVVSYLLCPAVK